MQVSSGTRRLRRKIPLLFGEESLSLVCTVGVIGPSHFAGAGMRSRASGAAIMRVNIRYKVYRHGRDALPREPP